MIREIKQTFTFSFKKSISKHQIQISEFSSKSQYLINQHQYSNHSQYSKTFQRIIFIDHSKSAFVFCLDDKFNNISNQIVSRYSIFTSSFLLKNFSKFYLAFLTKRLFFFCLDDSFNILATRSSYFAFAMSKYDIFAKRLRIFKNWFSSYFTSQELVDAEFYQKRNLLKCSDCRVSFHSVVLMIYKSYHNSSCSIVEKIKFEIELTKLQSHIQAKTEILTIELFKQKKIQLTEQKIQKQTQREIVLTEC